MRRRISLVTAGVFICAGMLSAGNLFSVDIAGGGGLSGNTLHDYNKHIEKVNLQKQRLEMPGAITEPMRWMTNWKVSGDLILLDRIGIGFRYGEETMSRTWKRTIPSMAKEDHQSEQTVSFDLSPREMTVQYRHVYSDDVIAIPYVGAGYYTGSYTSRNRVDQPQIALINNAGGFDTIMAARFTIDESYSGTSWGAIIGIKGKFKIWKNLSFQPDIAYRSLVIWYLSGTGTMHIDSLQYGSTLYADTTVTGTTFGYFDPGSGTDFSTSLQELSPPVRTARLDFSGWELGAGLCYTFSWPSEWRKKKSR